MASPNCWRCLSRPNTTQLTSSFSRLVLSPSASFSTTTIRSLPAPAKKKSGPAQTTKGQKTLRIKKKAPVKDKGKPPATGERKAMRKRIVLSNTNAFEVEGMRDLDEEMVDGLAGKLGPEEEVGEAEAKKENADGLEALMAQVAKAEGREGKVPVQVEVKPQRKLVGRELIGKVVGLKGETVDSLRAVEAFKITQGWGLFRRPGMLVREESVLLSERLIKAQEEKKLLRLVLDGEKGTGKSMMMLHAMATAFIKGWVVINIPEAQDITTAMTDYAPLPGTNPTLWTQNVYMVNVLTQIHKANNHILQNMEVTKEHNLPVPLQSNISLARLCELGARDPETAWPFFQAFWSEITAKGRPPVMMCLDGLQYIMRDSLYVAPDMSPVHSHDLAYIRHFVDLLSGKIALPNGGAVLAATNRSHAPISKSTNLLLKNAVERQTNLQIESENKAIQEQNKRVWNDEDFVEEKTPVQLTPKDPYEKQYDSRAEEVLKDIEVMLLKGISKPEARGLMEYWAQSGVLRTRVDESSVAEKWTLAGGGVVGEIQRGALWMHI